MAPKLDLAPARTIVLVGFMAAGKSTAGRLLADTLGWRFRDLDEEIERHTGLSVPALFRDRGESAFRELERALTAELLAEPATVVAPGGGWAARPGVLTGLPEGVVAVWLRVPAEVAVARARADGGTRPLLDTPDPLARARELLAEREPLYAGAAVHVEAGTRSPQEIVEEILERLGIGRGGWQARGPTGNS